MESSPTAGIRGHRGPSSGGSGRLPRGRSRAARCRCAWWLSLSVPPLPWLEPKDLVDENHGDPPGGDLPVDDQHLVHATVDAVRLLGAGILETEGVLVDPGQALVQVRHDLLCPHDEDDPPGADGIG